MTSRLALFENALKNHQTQDFWVKENIPQSKLENAIAHFPIPINSTVFGLIDTTVLGSCKHGLAITNLGLFWKNDWTNKSSKNNLTWNEFKESIGDMSIESYDIHFGKNIRFCLAGSSMKPAKAFHLFHEINNALNQRPSSSFQEKNLLVKKNDDIDQESNGADDIIYYDDIIASALALMSTADGIVDDGEIELVLAFINEDDSIANKDLVITRYEELIEKLVASNKKSSAIFKLQSEKLILNIRKLKNKQLIRNLKIMLEGMLDIVGGNKNTQTSEMMKRIMSSF